MYRTCIWFSKPEMEAVFASVKPFAWLVNSSVTDTSDHGNDRYLLGVLMNKKTPSLAERSSILLLVSTFCSFVRDLKRSIQMESCSLFPSGFSLPVSMQHFRLSFTLSPFTLPSIHPFIHPSMVYSLSHFPCSHSFLPTKFQIPKSRIARPQISISKPNST